MKQFIKNNWFKISLLAILIIVISGAFYWFQFRPSQIRKKCYDIAAAISGFNTLEINYQNCLRDNGLNK